MLYLKVINMSVYLCARSDERTKPVRFISDATVLRISWADFTGVPARLHRARIQLSTSRILVLPSLSQKIKFPSEYPASSLICLTL